MFAHFVHPDDLEKEISGDISQAKSHEKAKVREAQRVREKAREKQERLNLYGFEKRFSGVQLGRVLDTLGRQQGLSGTFLTRREHIENLVRRGYVVKKHPKYGRVIEAPDGSFYLQEDVTKTALDYADYLHSIGFGKVQPQSVQAKDVTDHPTLIEYGVQEMLKGKGRSPEVAAKVTRRRLEGGSNMMLGSPTQPVTINEDRLAAHLFNRIVEQAKKNIASFKPGARDMAIGAAVDGFKQGKLVERRVREALPDPAEDVDAVMMEAFGFGSDT